MQSLYLSVSRTQKSSVYYHYKVHFIANNLLETRATTGTSLLLAALKACGNLRDLETGVLIHALAVQGDSCSNVYVSNTLVSMYAKCWSMTRAREVFDAIQKRNVVSWNTLIYGYVENREEEYALSVYARMGSEVVPDDRTYVAVLKACGSLATKEEPVYIDGMNIKVSSLNKGMEIHSRVVCDGFVTDIFVGNTLIDMYCKCGSSFDARLTFDKMLEYTVVSYTALLMSYVENGEAELSLSLFECMPLEPNEATFLAAFKSVTILATRESSKLAYFYEKGLEIEYRASLRGFVDSSEFVASAIVDMHAKCGFMTHAKRVFDRNPCTASWNTLLMGYVENGEAEVALEVFYRMQTQLSLEPDSRTYVAVLNACTSLPDGREIHLQLRSSGYDSNVFVASSLVKMYARFGLMQEARGAFNKAINRDITLWTSLLMGYVENGEEDLALELFTVMQREGFKPNSRTLVVMLKACSSLALKHPEKLKYLQKGRDIHTEARKTCISFDLFLSCALVDMYAKCGSLPEAQGVFNSMKACDVVSWTALIVGYSENGMHEAALELFAEFHLTAEYKPDSHIYVAVLSACGDASALDSGKAIHAEVCRYGFECDELVVNSLLDFYGKTGVSLVFEVVFDLAVNSVSSWTALIAAYGIQGDRERVFTSFGMMLEKGVKPNGITFVCVLSACSHAGFVEEGLKCFNRLTEFGVSPEVEHYRCIVDVLGRANEFGKALKVVYEMPFKEDAMMWRILLGACWKWKNVGVARIAFESLMRLDGGDEVGYILMEKIYGSAGMWEEQAVIQVKRTHNIGKSKP